MSSVPAPVVLAPEDWRARSAAHLARVRAWTEPHRQRAARGEKHPVWDFLFEYYAFRPAWLERWHPGPDVVLLGAANEPLYRPPAYRAFDAAPSGETPPPPCPLGGVALDLERAAAERGEFIRWLLHLLEGVESRPAFFGCHGLHEWAMVYRQPEAERRHLGVPLRLSSSEIAAAVESLPLRCTHFDAFRFFTTAARPLNRVQPERSTAPALEQRGCLHANMDLYKWASKLAPFAPSELIADTFALAREIRELDMCASPYDLAALGFEPVRIESPAGRAEYEARQRGFAARAEPLRRRLVALCRRLVQAGASGREPDAYRHRLPRAELAAGDAQEAELSRH